MERLERSYQQKAQTEALKGRVVSSTVERLHAAALEGESFEDAAAALQSVETLQDFRKKTSRLPFGSFHEIVEEVTNLNRLPLSEEERINQAEVLVQALEQKAARLSPRVADLYLSILAEIKSELYEPKFDITKEKISRLKSTVDEKGNPKRSDLDILFAPDVSWDLKLNRIETRFDDGENGYLSGLRALDRRQGREMDDDIRKWREEEIKKIPRTPPEDTDRSKPGVDPMERKREGEPTPAIWQIQRAYDGYYKRFREKAFPRWDNTRKEWVGEYRYADVETIPLSGNINEKKGHIDLEQTAIIPAGERRRIPIPDTHSLSRVEVAGRRFKAEQNQDGDISIFIEGSGNAEVKVFLAPNPDKKFKSDPKEVGVPNIPSEFTEETNNKLEEIKNKKRGNIARAKAIRSYVRRRIKYLAPKTREEADRYNTLYNTHPKGYAGAVDEIKKADCDVENTYFSALCAKLNIPTRHIVGHSVDEDDEGNLITHFGTGHAWSDVWDEVNEEWVMMDATSAGDPNLEEKDDQKKKKHRPGNDDEQEAVGLSDEELEALRQKLAIHNEKLSYTLEERTLAEALAKRAGKKLEEMLSKARQINKEIMAAENSRLPGGERIIEVLNTIWSAIVESRKTQSVTYEGPVRRSEGGERIQSLIRHFIGVQSGDPDPISREKEATEIQEEKIYGGFDLHMIGDKSGSMSSVYDEIEDEHERQGKIESLLLMQRRAMYLILASLYEFDLKMRRAGIHGEGALDIRTETISFRGDDKETDLDLDKPLSSVFTPLDKVVLWDSLSNQGGGNGDSMALNYVSSQIHEDMKTTDKKRLRVLIACSDGGYIGDEARMRDLAEELGNAGVIVVGMGLTNTARSVKEVMHNPPHSYGDLVESIDDLPALVAKYVVQEALKLFPAKSLEDRRIQKVIEESLAKFNKKR